MGGLLVIGFFVLLGLGVFFTAMRGGPKASAPRTGPSRGSRKTTAIGVTLVTACVGIGLPIYILIHNNDKQSAGGPGGSTLTAGQKDGRGLFTRNCATCHTLEDSGAVGKVGPDFDVLKPQASLTVNAIAQGRARGRGQMPAELLNGQDAQNVASYIAAVAGH